MDIYERACIRASVIGPGKSGVGKGVGCGLTLVFGLLLQSFFYLEVMVLEMNNAILLSACCTKITLCVEKVIAMDSSSDSNNTCDCNSAIQ